nr:type I restriction endonuclease [Nitrobacter winogradskyi]
MHIDHDDLVLKSEGDVEAKLLFPLLMSELYLGIPSQNVFSKEYLAPSDLDKGAKVAGGYYPDASVWVHGFPIVMVEAKAPGVPVEQAYREAALYARHLNSQRPAGFNPANFIIASSGDCPPSGLLRQFRGFREGRISGSSQPIWSADETEIRAGESTGRAGREGHPPGNAPAVLG